MLMGDLLEEFFARPYVAAKVAEGRLPDTWREGVGGRGESLTPRNMIYSNERRRWWQRSGSKKAQMNPATC